MNFLISFYDSAERLWFHARTRRIIGTTLVVAFLFSLAAIEANRLGWLPASLATLLPASRFAAVETAFNLLLLFEIIELVFALSESVSRSLGKQFEVIALVLLRDTFKELSNASDPLTWESVSPLLPNIAAASIAALLIFAILGFFYYNVSSEKFFHSEFLRKNFTNAKKIISLLLLAALIFLGIRSLFAQIAGFSPNGTFLESFFTLLIFSDVLIVLISLRYSVPFEVTFRFFAYTLATLTMRLALLTPGWRGALLASGAALYALAVLWVYNLYRDLPSQHRGKNAYTENDKKDNKKGRVRKKS